MSTITTWRSTWQLLAAAVLVALLVVTVVAALHGVTAFASVRHLLAGGPDSICGGGANTHC